MNFCTSQRLLSQHGRQWMLRRVDSRSTHVKVFDFYVLLYYYLLNISKLYSQYSSCSQLKSVVFFGRLLFKDSETVKYVFIIQFPKFVINIGSLALIFILFSLFKNNNWCNMQTFTVIIKMTLLRCLIENCFSLIKINLECTVLLIIYIVINYCISWIVYLIIH